MRSLTSSKELDDDGLLPDPPGPNPAMCHNVGAQLAEVLSESPYRTVIMASSSWSHCFLSPNSGYVVPDFEADRSMLDALQNGWYDYVESFIFQSNRCFAAFPAPA